MTSTTLKFALLHLVWLNKHLVTKLFSQVIHGIAQRPERRGRSATLHRSRESFPHMQAELVCLKVIQVVEQRRKRNPKAHKQLSVFPPNQGFVHDLLLPSSNTLCLCQSNKAHLEPFLTQMIRMFLPMLEVFKAKDKKTKLTRNAFQHVQCCFIQVMVRFFPLSHSLNTANGSLIWNINRPVPCGNHSINSTKVKWNPSLVSCTVQRHNPTLIVRSYCMQLGLNLYSEPLETSMVYEQKITVHTPYSSMIWIVSPLTSHLFVHVYWEHAQSKPAKSSILNFQIRLLGKHSVLSIDHLSFLVLMGRYLTGRWSFQSSGETGDTVWQPANNWCPSPHVMATKTTKVAIFAGLRDGRWYMIQAEWEKVGHAQNECFWVLRVLQDKGV